ncbi:MAG: hypothetical protein QXP31_07760 [Pyrobaculum sp.]
MEKEAPSPAEGYALVKKSVVYGVVAAVLMFVIFMGGLFAALAAQSLAPLTVAVALIGFLIVWPSYYMRKAFLIFHEAYRRDIYNTVATLLLISIVLVPIFTTAQAAWLQLTAATAPGAGLPDFTTLRILGWPIGVAVAAVWYVAFRDLAHDSGVDMFHAVGIVGLVAAILSFVQAATAVLGLVEIILLYVAANRALELSER